MNRNALTAVSVSLQLEIRSRNEEAINSTRNSIYSPVPGVQLVGRGVK